MDWSKFPGNAAGHILARREPTDSYDHKTACEMGARTKVDSFSAKIVAIDSW